jgi:hypothetical protein
MMQFTSHPIASLAVIVCVGGLVGCGSPADSSGGGASMEEMAARLDAQEAYQKEQQAAAEKKSQEAAAREAAGAEEASQAATEPAAASERQVAGRERVGEGGYYTAIVGARRHVLNRVEDLAWVQAVQHFQATEGRLPKDHNEFMTRIVEEHGIDLGFKEENQEFLYDPSQGQWGEVYVVEKLEEPAQK